jgi:HPt (histidine-containing phosphotransfer) domain-containing protein
LNHILNTLIRDKHGGGHGAVLSVEEGEHVTVLAAGAHCAPLQSLKSIKELDVDSALEVMGGFADVYFDAVKLTLRMLPIRIEKMDSDINADTKSFTTEVHGLKSALKIIGAATLGNNAAKLETAAKEGDMAYCFEHYPPFRADLAKLEKSLSEALAKMSEESAAKKAGAHCTLRQDIPKAKEAVQNFDRDLALDIISPHSDFAYDEKTDELLREIINSLGAFDCEGALNKLINLEVSLNEIV